MRGVTESGVQFFIFSMVLESSFLEEWCKVDKPLQQKRPRGKILSGDWDISILVPRRHGFPYVFIANLCFWLPFCLSNYKGNWAKIAIGIIKIQLSQSSDKIFPRVFFCCKGLSTLHQTSKNEHSGIMLNIENCTPDSVTPPHACLSVTVFIYI